MSYFIAVTTRSRRGFVECVPDIPENREYFENNKRYKILETFDEQKMPLIELVYGEKLLR